MIKKQQQKILTEERRKRYRLKKSLTVVRCSEKYLFEKNHLSMDISEDGICLLTQSKMEIGETVELGIYLPEFKKPIVAVGEVVRRNGTNDPNFSFIVGIKFIEITPGAYHQIANHIRYYAVRD